MTEKKTVSRRGFLETAGIATGAVAAAGRGSDSARPVPSDRPALAVVTDEPPLSIPSPASVAARRIDDG